MTTLIARLEQATGPDRELDKDIMRLLYAHSSIPNCLINPPQYLPEYTDSLDAALTTLPEGWGLICLVIDGAGKWRAGLSRQRDGKVVVPETPTQSMETAILIAALEARGVE